MGLPDWTRGQRNIFGSARWAGLTQTITANDETVLNTVVGRGVIYGGSLRVDTTASQLQDIVKLKVDSLTVANAMFTTLNKFNMITPESGLVHQTLYDNVNFEYAVAFSFGITFEESFSVIYVENAGNIHTPSGEIIHALI